MKSITKRCLMWCYCRGLLTSERLAGLFRKHPWLRGT
jgi:hypothetical protein